MCLVCLLCVFSFYEVTSDNPSLKLPYNNYIYFPIFILEKEPVFPFLMFSAKQENYWYHFFNVFGMTRSLTGDWTTRRLFCILNVLSIF